MKAEFTAIIEPAPEGRYWLFAQRYLVQMDTVRQSKRQKLTYNLWINPRTDVIEAVPCHNDD